MTTTTTGTPTTATDDGGLGAATEVVEAMSGAWNAGDGAAFAAAFTQDAEFVAFEGTVLTGREAIVAYHQPLFDTLLQGSRLSPADVVFARLVGEEGAVVHNRVSVTMPGEDRPLPSRDSMQLFVLRRAGDGWVVEAMQNSRIISLERQGLLDAVASLSPQDAGALLAGLAGGVSS